MDATLLLSLLLPLLIAAALYFIFFGKGNKASGDKVLLFGPMGSGKTALSLQLRFGKVTPTYTSLQKTVSRCQLQSEDTSAPAKSITLVDMPGSGRLRSQLLSEAGAAAVLVCVLDGTQLAAQCKEAAGMLFDILTVEAVQQRASAILVVVNKSEGRGVGSPQSACSMLESEVQKVRVARTTMADTASGAAGDIPGASASGFSFKQARMPTEFVAASAQSNDLAAFRAFVRTHIS